MTQTIQFAKSGPSNEFSRYDRRLSLMFDSGGLSVNEQGFGFMADIAILATNYDAFAAALVQVPGMRECLVRAIAESEVAT